MEYVGRHQSEIAKHFRPLATELDHLRYELVEAADRNVSEVDRNDQQEFPRSQWIVTRTQVNHRRGRHYLGNSEK